jgi:hypothetical protein
MVSSADRIKMYGIEKWPSDLDHRWLSKMRDARAAAMQSGLDAALVKTAAGIGIVRLLRSADEFQTRMFKRIRGLVNAHAIPISEVMRELQHRIVEVRSAFELTEEQADRAVVVGLRHYADDGGSPEFAIRLADVMGIAEEQRYFLRVTVDL